MDHGISSTINQLASVLDDHQVHHGEIRLFKISNHEEFTDGQIFVKVPSPKSLFADRIDYELRVLQYLGLYEARGLSLPDGRPMLITKAMGTTPGIDTEDVSIAAAWAEAVRKAHESYSPAPWMKDSVIGLPRFWDTQEKRYRSITDKSLRERAIGHAETLVKDLPEHPAGPQVFLHGDSNLRNFFIQNRRAYLVDWESACIGQCEWDYATMAMVCLLDNRDDLWRAAQPVLGPIDQAAFDWSLKVNLAASLAHAAWREGAEGVSRREKLHRTLSRHGTDWLLSPQ